MAMLAFWVLEVSTFIFILFAFEYIASGHMFPLDILPSRRGAGGFFHSLPLPAVFPGQDLHGQDRGGGPGAGHGCSSGLGVGGVCVRAVYVAAGNPEILGCGRLMNTSRTKTVARGRTSPLGRYLRIYAALWRNSVTREMTFKSNFLLWIIVELLWFALQLGFIGVLYLQTDHIGTWTKWQVVMLIGASHLIQQIFQAFFLINCTNLSELVRTGKLDFLLLLPVNTRFVVSLRQVDLGAFVNALSALGIMVYAGYQLHLAPTVLQVAGFSGALPGRDPHPLFPDVPAGEH